MTKSPIVSKTLKFKKVAHPNIDGTLYFYEINDARILMALDVLQKQYSFTIVKVALKDPYGTSRIKIKCKRDEWYSIVQAFTGVMGGYISEVTI